MILVLGTIVILQLAAGAPVREDPLDAAAVEMKAGDYAGAQAIYERLLSTQPTNEAAQEGEVEASEKLALAARAAHDDHAAIGELIRAQTYAAGNTRLLYDTGVLEDQLGLYQEAEVAVLHLQQLLPGDSRMLYLLARVKLDRGQLPEAELAMRAYLKSNPEDATAYYGLGRILQLRVDNEGARAAFETVDCLEAGADRIPVSTGGYRAQSRRIRQPRLKRLRRCSRAILDTAAL